MERFDIRGEWRMQPRKDGKGTFAFADEALVYRDSFWSSFFLNVVMVVVCALLSAYIVFHKHDPVPVISTEEYEATVQEQRRLQVELATANKKIADLKAKSAQLAAMVQTQNAVVRQREQQLKELHASVPPQPVILEAIRKEASTEEGLQAAVTRNFGAIKVKVVE